MAALAVRRGGVGYYPHSDFIHVDVGHVRQWCFDCPANLIAGGLTRIRITLLKHFFERGVVPVDVIVKVNDAILRHDHGGIND